MKSMIILFLICAVLLSCSKEKTGIRFGVIKPSLNYLPLIVGLEKEIIDPEKVDIVYFNSGWETNEALVAGRIDLAIMPFTYVWMDVGQERDVVTLSFLERESDGIIAGLGIDHLTQLKGKKIAVLRASTLDLFAEIISEKYQLDMELIYFRTPMDMAAALGSGEVDALSFYTPSIFNLPEDNNIIHWYSHDFPLHPCCNLVVNTSALLHKSYQVISLQDQLKASCELLEDDYDAIIAIAADHYGLDPETVKSSLQHTRYMMGVEESGRELESLLAGKMVEKGYLEKMADTDRIYYEED